MSPPVPPLPAASELRRYRSRPDPFGPRPEYVDNSEAQNYVWDAWEIADPMGKFRLCEKALQRFPFCVDAYACMGDIYHRFWNENDKAVQCCEYGIAAAKLLWPGIEEEEEIAWGHIENRPFLRAKHCLAVVLLRKDELPKAIEILRFLLRVCPSDNQGCRIILFQALIDKGDYSEAEEIAKKHSEGRKSNECYFRYGFVVIDFLKNKLGVCEEQELEDTLALALQNNNWVPQLLLQKDPLPECPTHTSPGSMDEAISFVRAAKRSWERTPGLLDWLRALESRDGPKPEDDGSILFYLLTKGNVLVSVRERGNVKIHEVTTLFYNMRGQKVDGFALPPGMKQHDPSKIVCFSTDWDSGGFISFPYSDVQNVSFWSLLRSSKTFAKDRKEHFCAKCYEPANKRCGKCLVTWYCSAACQKEDFKNGRPPHKVLCPNYIKK